MLVNLPQIAQAGPEPGHARPQKGGGRVLVQGLVGKVAHRDEGEFRRLRLEGVRQEVR